jgi:hypothetical protein
VAIQRLTRALAALFPPLAVLSSAHELYLRNQQDLDRTLSVLHPFWAAAAAAAVVALLLQAVDRAPARAAVVSFYAAGFAFVTWSFLRALPAAGHVARWVLDSPAGAAVFLVAWMAVAVAAGRRLAPRSLEPALAVLAVVLAAREVALFGSRLDRRPPPPPRDLAAEFGPRGDPARPNVYHLILDGFQDELLEPCLPAGDPDALAGFVRFRAMAPIRSTQQVVPLIFSGRSLSSGSADERIREGLAGESSLVKNLRDAGYRTFGLVPRFIYEKNPSALDLLAFHEESAQEPDLPGLHAAVFLRLWAYETLPRSVAEPLARGRFLGLGADFFRMASVDRLSNDAQPVVALLSMESFVELEPRLPARGRYTLVHLLLPHMPYVLRSDCSREGTATTDLEQQSRCTLRLLVRFLDTLRRLDRLDGSILVVHGDHGSGEILREGRLVSDEPASLRTALLFKPVGGHGPMRRAGRTARLVDIAPTLLAMLGIAREAPFDGTVLEEALPEGGGGPYVATRRGAAGPGD